MVELVRLTVCAHEGEADLVANILESQGISCLIQRSPDMDVPEMLSAGKRQVMVSRDDFYRASELLSEVAGQDDGEPIDYRVRSQSQLRIVGLILLAIIIIALVSQIIS